MYTIIYFNEETRQFSTDVVQKHRDEMRKQDTLNSKRRSLDLERKLARNDYKMKTRSHLSAKLHNATWNPLTLKDRLKNWTSGAGFKGDVKAGKAARLAKKLDKEHARQEYNEKMHELDHRNITD